jgi:hypothetical protein
MPLQKLMPLRRLILYGCASVTGWCCAGALVLLPGLLSAAENAALRRTPGSVSLQIGNQAGAEFKLEVRQAPLAQVLKEIAAKTGARIHYSVLPEAPVSATCVSSTVRQIMDCLVAKQVGLVANKPEQGKPAEFWLLGSSVGSCKAMTVEPIAAQAQAATTPQPELTPKQQAQADQAMQVQSDQFLELTKAKEPGQRAEAISNLISGGMKDDPHVRKALVDAMTDKDANVRAQAVTALARREGEGASDQLRQALKDSDTTVRMMVVDNAGNDASLLQQALADKDPMIRNYAASKLEALNAK